MQFGYALNLSICVGCRKCAEACHQENNHDRATHNSYIRVLEMEQGSMDMERGNTSYDHAVPAPGKFYMPVQCQQCDNPPCVQVCPVEATWKEKDGIVVVDYNWCIGCRYCEAACPYHARRFNWTKPEIPAAEVNPDQGYLSNRIRPQGVMEKCTFCLHRTPQRPAARLPRGLPDRRARVRQPPRPRQRDPLGAREQARVRPQGGARDPAALLLLLRRVTRRARRRSRPLTRSLRRSRRRRAALTYPRFLWRARVAATDGSWLFYAWMTLLTAVALVGAQRLGRAGPRRHGRSPTG